MAFDGKSIVTGARMGFAFGRGVSAWMLKRRLEGEGYDPITIDAAVEAVKAGRDPQAILAAAKRTYAAKEKQEAFRANPPPVFGSAHWGSDEHLQAAALLRAPDDEPGHGLDLGSHAASGKPIYWSGESHLLTVAPTRTGKSTLAIVPNLLRYRGSAVVLDPKGELAAATANWRREGDRPVYILNPFGLAAAGPTRHAFNPLDDVKDERDATKLAEMIYPRLNDERQRFFDNEAIGFLSAVILFTARYAPPDHEASGPSGTHSPASTRTSTAC